MDEDYAKQNYKDKTNTEEETAAGKVVRSNKGATTKALVLDDEGFWNRVAKHVAVTLPIFKMLRRFDTGSPTLGKLYSSWFELGEHLKETESDFRDIAVEKHAERWAYGHEPLAAAAYVLDPEFHGHSQESNTEVVEGFMDTVEKVGILVAARKAAEESPGIETQWEKRAELLLKDPNKQTTWTHYPKYPTTQDEAVKDFCSKVSAQITMYRARKGACDAHHINHQRCGIYI